jgi:hypothetical protein
MFHTDRASSSLGSNQGRRVRIEELEGRVLLSGGLGGGDDGGKFKLPAVQSQSALADFNGDGKADLATLVSVDLGRKLSASAVLVQLGKGNGRFTPSAVKILSAKASAIVTGDFNGDKNHDIAVLGTDAAGKATATILTGDGKGGFTVGASQNLGTMPLSNVAAGDVNGDGFADLISFNQTNVFEALNDGAGKLLPAVSQDSPFAPNVALVGLGDIDGDGHPDLLGLTGDNQLLVSKATASTGVFQLTFIPTLASSIPLAGKKIFVADVSGDGRNDLIAVGDGSVNVAIQNVPAGGISFAPWVATNADVNAKNVLVGDIDGDGKADVIRLSGGGDDDGHGHGGVTRARLVLISNGDGTFHKLVADNNGNGNGQGHGDDDDDGDQGDDD